MKKRDGHKFWDPNICLLFLDEVLDFLLREVPESESDADILELTFNPSFRQIQLSPTTRKPFEVVKPELYSLWS